MLPQSRYLQKCSAYLATVSLSGKNCLVIGATQGIGRSVAAKLSSLGANVTVSGRSKEAGSSVIELMRNKSITEDQKHSFERVDLTSQKDTKRFLESTSEKLKNSGGLDYLFLTAGKPPNGKQSLTVDGIEAHFALQCLGRYSAASKFADVMNEKGAITVVCAPGGGTSVPLDDLEYLKPENKSRYGIIAAGNRDSLFVDAVLLNVAKQQASQGIKVVHLFPGGINTNASQTAGFPAPLPFLARTFGPYVLTSPNDYAVTPIYEALTASDSTYDNYFPKNQYGNEVKLGKWVLEEANQKACVEYAERRIQEATSRTEGIDGSQVGELGIGA